MIISFLWNQQLDHGKVLANNMKQMHGLIVMEHQAMLINRMNQRVMKLV